MSQNPLFKKASLGDWHKAAAKSAPGGDVQALNWVTPDGITVKPLYTSADTQGLPYADTLPGFEPFLRGPQATMYAVRPWTIRQFAPVNQPVLAFVIYHREVLHAHPRQRADFIVSVDFMHMRCK